jgi:hypothetical protein
MSRTEKQTDNSQLLYFPLSRLSRHESIFEDSEKGIFTEKYSQIFTPILGKQLALNTYYDNDLVASSNTPITIELLRIFDELKINFKVNNRNVTDEEKNLALEAALIQIIKSKKSFLDGIEKKDVPIIQDSVKNFITQALTEKTINSFESHYQQVKG